MLCLLVLLKIFTVDAGNEPVYQPEQIHIAFGEKSNDIVVTWVTPNDPGESIVRYGESSPDNEASGTRVVFEDARNQWIHRVTLKDLKFNSSYVYNCGSEKGISENLEFRTVPDGADWMLRAIIYGDLGVENARSLPDLRAEAENGNMDMILHVGDLAYDMYEHEGAQGDQFMRQMQPCAAAMPYMTCPGNHENDRNFSQYKNRLTMPQREQFQSMFYSWDIQHIHFIAVNTEAYYFMEFGVAPIVTQYNWLVEDLEKAVRNREKRPWIIMYGHRPMYCSDKWDFLECHFELTRTGVYLIGHKSNFSIEPLLKKYGVDIVIWAHEHSYERTWPIYDHKVYNGSLEQPYVNPRAPIHIITGSAGCREDTDDFGTSPPEWSAFRSSDYGYTRFHAHNATHVFFEQISVDQNSTVIDSFWIVQEQHGSFSM